MKSAFLVALVLAPAALAAESQETAWHLNLPESGLVPSAASFEMFSYLRETHGPGKLAMQSYSFSLPLADPRRSGYRDWALAAGLDTRITHMHARAFHLRKRELYSFSLPMAATRRYADGDRLMVAFAPTLASDFVKWDRSFTVNGMAQYTWKVNDRFSWSLGLGVVPRYVSYGMLPLVAFDWQPDDYWTIRLSRLGLTALRDMGNGVSAGVFARAAGGSWTVETEEPDTRMFRVRSLVAGGTVQWDFSRPGERKRILYASVGMPVLTTAEFCRFNAPKETMGKHHYKTGVYAAAGVDFRF